MFPQVLGATLSQKRGDFGGNGGEGGDSEDSVLAHFLSISFLSFNAMTDEDEFESIADAGEAESAPKKRSTTTTPRKTHLLSLKTRRAVLTTC